MNKTDDPSDVAARLHEHLKAISSAILRTRQEIADLRHAHESNRACDELHAVVQGTEDATNAILTASERVDSLARGMMRRSSKDADKADATAIQIEMQTIFEACNFQDLTGQRISKVVRTIELIEVRIGEMLRIWAGSDDAQPQRASRPEMSLRKDEEGLLNGPALPGAAAVSQDVVDALFP